MSLSRKYHQPYSCKDKFNHTSITLDNPFKKDFLCQKHHRSLIKLVKTDIRDKYLLKVVFSSHLLLFKIKYKFNNKSKCSNINLHNNWVLLKKPKEFKKIEVENLLYLDRLQWGVKGWV
jgi:hypothetical protein